MAGAPIWCGDIDAPGQIRACAQRALALGASPSIPYVNSGVGVSIVTAHPTFMTVDEFLEHRFPDGKVELVRGEPRVMAPASGAHGGVVSNLLA